MSTPENNQQKTIGKNLNFLWMNQLNHCRKTTNKKLFKNSREKIKKNVFQITNETTTKQLKQNITSKTESGQITHETTKKPLKSYSRLPVRIFCKK